MSRLESAGLLNRETDPEDRRRNLATLTPAGPARLNEIQRHAGAEVAAVREVAGETELRHQSVPQLVRRDARNLALLGREGEAGQ